MQKIPLDADARSLTHQELSAAKKEKILEYDYKRRSDMDEEYMEKYPKVIRCLEDPPIPGQPLGTFSFYSYSGGPRVLKVKDKEYRIYAWIKLRGNWNSKEQCVFESSKIIKKVDSFNSIKIAPVGVWIPLVEDDYFCKEFLDVRMNDEELHLRDEKVQDNKQKEEQIMRELREKENELKTTGDIHDDPKSLTYYTMRRVTRNMIKSEMERREKDLEVVRKKFEEVVRELASIDEEFPEYSREWMNLNNSERKKVGLPPLTLSEEEVEEYEKDKARV